ESGVARPTFALELRGWAVGRELTAVATELVHDDVVLRRVALDVLRPKLAALHPATSAGESIGFRATIGMLRLPRDFELVVRAVMEDGERVPIGSVRGRRAALR